MRPSTRRGATLFYLGLPVLPSVCPAWCRGCSRRRLRNRAWIDTLQFVFLFVPVCTYWLFVLPLSFSCSFFSLVLIEWCLCRFIKGHYDNSASFFSAPYANSLDIVFWSIT